MRHHPASRGPVLALPRHELPRTAARQLQEPVGLPSCRPLGRALQGRPLMSNCLLTSRGVGYSVGGTAGESSASSARAAAGYTRTDAGEPGEPEDGGRVGPDGGHLSRQGSGAAQRRSRNFPAHEGPHAAQITAYGQCVLRNVRDTRKDACAAEFAALRTCFQRAVRVHAYRAQFSGPSSQISRIKLACGGAWIVWRPCVPWRRCDRERRSHALCWRRAQAIKARKR